MASLQDTQSGAEPSPSPSTTLPPSLKQQIRLLIRANHILHQHNLVDAFGHISIRNPLDPTQYLIAAYDPGAPALVSSARDFITYFVSDSSPVDLNAPQGYSERFIHGEILKRFPHATCVVHSHSEVVIPFTLGNVEVKPVFHMAGFMSAAALPVLDVADTYATLDTCEPDMLIKNQVLGAVLAEKVSEAQPVVLQHKHGFTTFGRSVEEAVYRALYTQTNCRLLKDTIDLAGGDAGKVAYLTREEAEACAVMNKKCQDKSFRLWLREVQVNPLYTNDEGEPEKGEVGGMKM
ncbi:Nn.00g043580.m01.CDS01 [Neocucurbitaria sp. VM-36]